MEVKKRIAVVGLGSIGFRHSRLLNEREDVSVEFVEPNAETLAKAKKEIGDLPSHNSFEEMLATKPEMVLIATPHSMHCRQTVLALEAGIDVLCEKPMSDSLASAKEMKAAADRTGRVLDIGFTLHFDPKIRRLKELVDNGTLGTVLHAHTLVGTYLTLVLSGSRYQSRQEGALFFDYAHQPDLFYWMLGKKPTAVYASAVQGGDIELSSNPNIVLINCEYDSPLVTSVHLNYVQMPLRGYYEIVGDKAYAVLDAVTGTLAVGYREEDRMATETIGVERDDLYRDEHQAFLDAVAGKRKPETSADAGLVSTAICEAAMKSWQSHKRVGIEL